MARHSGGSACSEKGFIWMRDGARRRATRHGYAVTAEEEDGRVPDAVAHAERGDCGSRQESDGPSHAESVTLGRWVWCREQVCLNGESEGPGST
jgi:hypothetical protein